MNPMHERDRRVDLVVHSVTHNIDIADREVFVEQEDFGRKLKFTAKGSDPVIIDASVLLRLPDNKMASIIYDISEKLRHGSFSKLIEKYDLLKKHYSEMKDEKEKQQAIIDNLEKEVLKLETSVENFRDLYHEERNRSQ